MSLWIIFLTGLTTGGLSCLAVQGGLLTSIIANQKESELGTRSIKSLEWISVILFLGTKLLAHIVLGFLLGWLGSKLSLSLSIRLIFQGLAAFFMIGTALNLLEVHPIFRYLLFQPPRFIRHWLKRTTYGESFFTPAILGFLTIFIPCGVTQSMEVLAISSGSPILGATIMGAFVLGTSPLFAVIGVATAKLSETFQTKFLRVAAVALLILAVTSLNGILVVLNSPVTVSTFTHPVTYFFSDERFGNTQKTQQNSATQYNGLQEVNILARSNGYSPDTFTVKAGMPVKLTVHTKDTFSCASTFLFRPFNIALQLGPNDSQSTTFTPTQPGKYQFTCAMGMYKGVMEVI